MDEVGQGQAGAEVVGRTAGGIRALDPLKVALVADVLPQGGFEQGWVDDARRGVVEPFGTFGVQGAGAVATLTADRQAVDHEFPIAVGLDLIDVAKKAFAGDRAVKMAVDLVVIRGQIPAIGLGVPGDGRLVETTAAIDDE